MDKKFTVIILLCSLLFVISGCITNVKDKDYDLAYNSKIYEGKYTGTMEKNVPVKYGKFKKGDENDANYIIYLGEWNDGKLAGNGTLNTNNYSFDVEKVKWIGAYSGAVVDGLPNGEGTFKAKDNNHGVYEYTGNWQKGIPCGKGKLLANKYVVHFDEFDKIGKYNGDVLDGKPSGQGTFTAKTDDGEEYTYTGEWKNGIYNGQGVLKFTNGKHGIYDGKFVNGKFTPTIIEWIQYKGSDKKNCPYSLTNIQKKFIKETEKAYKKHDVDTIKKNIGSFQYKSFTKNINSFKPCFVKIHNLTVIQIMEYKSFNNEVETFLLLDKDYGNQCYSVYYSGRMKNVNSGDTLSSLTILPLGYSTYEMARGGSNWSLPAVAVDFQK